MYSAVRWIDQRFGAAKYIRKNMNKVFPDQRHHVTVDVRVAVTVGVDVVLEVGGLEHSTEEGNRLVDNDIGCGHHHLR